MTPVEPSSSTRPVAAHQQRRIVAGVAVVHIAGRGVVDADEEADEAVGRAILGNDAIELGDDVGQGGGGIIEEHLHAGLQIGHEHGRGHALAGDIGDEDGHPAVVVGQEVVVIAAHGAAGRVVAGQVDAEDDGSAGGQQTALDVGGLFQFVGQEALGLFDLGQAGVFDADGGDVGHHGEQVEIVLGELVDEVRRIEVDQPDDAGLGLQRHGENAADLLLDDAHAFGEGLIETGVADQQGGAFVEDAVADGGADLEALAFGGADAQFAVFHGHENATRGAHGFDGEVHDEVEQLGQGAVAGEFASGADEGAHLRAAGDLLLLVQHTGEAGDDGAGWGRRRRGFRRR